MYSGLKSVSLVYLNEIARKSDNNSRNNSRTNLLSKGLEANQTFETNNPYRSFV